MKKRVIALLMAAALCLGVLPAVAMAADEATPTATYYEGVVTVTVPAGGLLDDTLYSMTHIKNTDGKNMTGYLYTTTTAKDGSLNLEIPVTFEYADDTYTLVITGKQYGMDIPVTQGSEPVEPEKAAVTLPGNGEGYTVAVTGKDGAVIPAGEAELAVGSTITVTVTLTEDYEVKEGVKVGEVEAALDEASGAYVATITVDKAMDLSEITGITLAEGVVQAQINGKNAGETTVEAGKEVTLTAALVNAAEGDVAVWTWTDSDETEAFVKVTVDAENGAVAVVAAVAEGEATITATATVGEATYTATHKITVTAVQTPPADEPVQVPVEEAEGAETVGAVTVNPEQVVVDEVTGAITAADDGEIEIAIAPAEGAEPKEGDKVLVTIGEDKVVEAFYDAEENVYLGTYTAAAGESLTITKIEVVPASTEPDVAIEKTVTNAAGVVYSITCSNLEGGEWLMIEVNDGENRKLYSFAKATEEAYLFGAPVGNEIRVFLYAGQPYQNEGDLHPGVSEIINRPYTESAE